MKYLAFPAQFAKFEPLYIQHIGLRTQMTFFVDKLFEREKRDHSDELFRYKYSYADTSRIRKPYRNALLALSLIPFQYHMRISAVLTKMGAHCLDQLS